MDIKLIIMQAVIAGTVGGVFTGVSMIYAMRISVAIIHKDLKHVWTELHRIDTSVAKLNERMNNHFDSHHD